MVETDIEKLSTCKLKLQITMPSVDVDKIRREQERAAQKDVVIQGFRKGKAPLHIVKSMYAGTIEKNTIDEALQEAFEESLRENKIIPVGPPLVKNIDYDDQKNLAMEVEVETYPEVELKNYKNFKFEKTVYKIDDDDVKENIDYIRKQKAVITAVDGEAKKGQFVTFSVQELDESGMPLIGKKYDDIRIQIGEGQFDPELESQIIGMKTDEQRIIQKTYPISAGKELAGKTERYSVTLQKIEKEELPELNDRFVEELNLDLKSTDDLKKKVREELEHRWGQESEQQFYHQVVQELLHENPFDIPEAMVNNYLGNILEDIRKRDKNIDEDEVRKHYRADAAFNIKWYHLREKIAEQEQIASTEEDFKQFLEKLEDANTRKLYESNKELKQRVMNDIFEKKVFDFLVDNSKVKEKKEKIKQRKAFDRV